MSSITLEQPRINLANLAHKPRLLDLFCGEGGAGEGYARAGFQVTGVDITDHSKRYPHTFIQADVLDLDPEWVASFDAIHASPPCQSFSQTSALHTKEYPDLLEPVRTMLQTAAKPYVIENVPRAPLHDPTVLCGTMFPELRVIRHRLFETNWTLRAPGPCIKPHPNCYMHTRHGVVPKKELREATRSMFDIPREPVGDPWTGYVTVVTSLSPPADAARDAMGMPWASLNGCIEAIPPAYTEWIGREMIRETNPEKRTVLTLF